MCATEDVLPTPTMLKLWGQGDGACPQGCVKEKGSLRHILCGCWAALNEKPQSRIKWRHDSILLAIFKAVLAVVTRFKKSQAEGKRSGKPEECGVICFKSHGILKVNSEGDGEETPLEQPESCFEAVRTQRKDDLLATASDWKLLFDIDAPQYEQKPNEMFPPEIAASTDRPDGVIWSRKTKTVVWIELTSPWEENMTIRHFEKLSRYNQLKIDSEARGWKVHPLCVEVGCRGYTSQSFQQMCKVLGFSSRETRDLKYSVEKTALHCSYAIFVHRYQREWSEKPLLDVSQWH